MSKIPPSARAEGMGRQLPEIQAGASAKEAGGRDPEMIEQKEYIKQLDMLHTETAALQQVAPLWKAFIECVISSGDYKIRLDALEKTVQRCRQEDRERERQKARCEQERRRRKPEK